MSRTVLNIFKVIIGTVVIMAVASITLEYYNVSTTGLQLQSIAKMSARQACIFFSQETYKRSDYTSIDTPDLYSADGDNVISGTFYSGGSPEGIYQNLYGSGSNFMSGNGPVKKGLLGYWENLDILVNKNDGIGVGDFYADSLMTPLNLGIPYLDRDVVEDIFKWNLTAILNNGQYNSNRCLNLHRDDYGYYILYKGFKVYTDKAKISDIKYKVLDITTQSGRDDFKKYTNMDASVLNSNGASSDERKYVCIAGIDYDIPMKYVGITPYKSIMEFAWNHEVVGLHGNPNAGQKLHTWNDDGISDMESGGFNGSKTGAGVLPVPGDLVYYIVR